MVSVLPYVDFFVFSRTSGGRAIPGLSVDAAPVFCPAIFGVSGTVANFPTCVVYHAIGACIICGLFMTAATTAARLGYHACSSFICSSHCQE